MTILFYITLLFYIPIVGMYVPPTSFGAGLPDISVERFFFYLLLLAFLTETAITKTRVSFSSKWLGIVFFFSLIVLASISWSNYSYNLGTVQTLSWKVFVPLFIAFLGHNLFSSKHNVDLYIKNIYICAGFLSLVSIFKMVLALASGHSIYRAGAAGTLSNPNALAVFLVLTIPCILHGIDKKIMPKAFGWAVTACAVMGVLCTVSRKGIATMFVAFFLCFIFKKQFKRLMALGILCAVLVPFLAGYAVFSYRFSSERLHEQFEGKANMAKAGWDMFKISPLIGFGYKGYHRLFPQHFIISRHDRYDAHNIYVTALVNYGIVGFVPFMAVFLYPIYFSAKIVRDKNGDSKTSYSKQMATICIASVVPFMISGWFSGGLFYSPTVLFLLYSQISFVLSIPTQRDDESMAD